MDPLAELVKIDPKSIGVGQYQKMSRVFVAAAALFGVPGNGALPEIEYRSLESG
jgi:hypothetical protein